MTSELFTDYILPVKITGKADNVLRASNLLHGKEMQIGLNEKEVCTVCGKGYIIFDFGAEYVGGIRILLHSLSIPTVKVRLRFGESLSECCAELGEKGSCNDHSIRDFIALFTAYSDTSFGCTGFRFLRIDVLEDATVAIKNVYCAYVHRNFSQSVLFQGTHEKDRLIFSVAKRTVELCCQEYLWDGIKRDRLVWVGDIHPEMLALTSMYGRCEIIEKSLDFSMAQFPSDTWMSNIPMYSAWLIIILADYRVFNREYVATKKEYIYQVLERLCACVGEDGNLDFPYYFVDWPTHEQVDEIAGCRALLTVCAKKCEEMFPLFGFSLDQVYELKRKLSLLPIDVVKAKQVVALKYWALGSISEQDKQLLIAGGATGMSTFMSYYILKAVAENCSVDVAVSMMRSYYGAMLDKGATTFFEDFDMEWVENSCRLDALPKEGERDIHGDFGKYCYSGFRHSFCHGWSAGVIKFLYEYCNE